MTREDTDRLFELLAIYRPGDKHLENRPLRLVWAMTLAPYTPEDVREAVASYFRECKYWPDVTDISTRCPPLPEPVRMPQPTATERDEKQEILFAQLARWWGEVRAAGLPATITEAKAAGLTVHAWNTLLAQNGFDCPKEWRKRE